MADATTTQTATPPAQSGGNTFTLDQVKSMIADAIKPFADQLKEVSAQAKIANDTLAALPPAKAGDGKAEEKQAEKTATITAESVAKLVADAIAADRKQQQDESAKQAARAAKIDAVAKAKLGGNADLAKLINAADDAGIDQQADLIAAQAKALKPDFGGAKADGGTTPNTGANAATAPGKWDFIKMPA
jgi:hypothetical protein